MRFTPKEFNVTFNSKYLSYIDLWTAESLSLIASIQFCTLENSVIESLIIAAASSDIQSTTSLFSIVYNYDYIIAKRLSHVKRVNYS